MIKEKNNDFKNMVIGFGVIFLYIILSAIPGEFIKIFGINYYKLSFILKQVYLILYEACLLALIIYIYKNIFIPDLKEFKKNVVSYLKKYIKYWFLIIILMIFSNYIISMFTTSNTSLNQQIIIKELKAAPIYVLIITIFIAPILEELVFRLSFRKIFAHTNILYIIFSGLFFGFMHVAGEDLINLLFIIPYSIPGFIFAYLYTKSNNICVPISLHIIHNFIMLILEIILLAI